MKLTVCTCLHPGMYKPKSIVVAAMQIVSDNPRWHFIDIGTMSAMLQHGQGLRDHYHPSPWFALEILNIFLNLHERYGSAAA